MGVKITSTNTRAPWNTRVLPPVTRGLVGWFDLDTEVRRGAFNRALGSKPGQVVGLPVAAPTHLTMSQSTGYIQTDIPEAVECTAFALIRTADLNNVMAGTYTGPVNTALSPPGVTATSSFGIAFWIDSTGRLSLTGCRVNADGQTVTSAGQGPDPASLYDHGWTIAVNRLTATTHSVFDKTKGKRNDRTGLFARVPSLSPWRIGAPTGNSTQSKPCDVSQLIVYNNALTDDEIDQVVEVMRKRATRLGIVA